MNWIKLYAACGAPIFVWHNPSSISVAMGAMVLAGGCDEEWPKWAGMAHAMEHIVFQSTENFASSKQLTKLIESCGGSLNANTWNERTFFYCVLPKDLSERGLMYLSEMLLRAKFDPKKIKMEMKNIVQEIKRSQDDPGGVADDTFGAFIYGNHPMGKEVLGTMESVTSFTREDFLTWRDKFYYPENFTFIFSGGMDPFVARDLVDKFFAKSKRSRLPFERHLPDFNLDTTLPRNLFVPRNDWKQAHVNMGAVVGPGDSQDLKVMDFFTDMLGGMSGPLFQEVRDKRGLAYSVSACTYPFKASSPVCIHVGTDPTKPDKVIEVVRQVIDRSKTSKYLFNSTRARILGHNAIYFDSATNGARISLAVNDIVVYGRPRVFEDYKKETESITLDQVEAVVDKYLGPDTIATVVVGPEA